MVDRGRKHYRHHLYRLRSRQFTDSRAVIADIRNYARMDALFQLYQPYVVYHAAAYHHVSLMEENPAQGYLQTKMSIWHCDIK
jgi:FlaA1/EpsC-like NDP-sugar epimerase